MKFPSDKRRPPFVKLPRHKRSSEVIRLKGKIRRDANEYGGLFTSDLVLNEPGRPDLYSQSFDFYFLGSDRFTIWNAQIVTAQLAFWEAIHEHADTLAWSALTQAEQARESKWEFEPASFSPTGKVLSYQIIKQAPARYKQFGGRTFSEQVDALEDGIIRNNPPAIFESFQLDRRYVYGIGLHIVLDVEVINQATIEAAIDRFFAFGETHWTSSEPVPRNRLPSLTEKAALEVLDGKEPSIHEKHQQTSQTSVG